MINRKTVFILGAGASNDLGFPVGSKLVDKITEDLGNESSELFKDVRRLFGDRNEIREFHRLIKLAPPPTIDHFLNNQNENITRIGKICIAKILIPHEDPNELLSLSRKNWFNHLLGRMYTTSQEEFKEHNILFLTFNYDRSLEQFFYNAFQGMFGLSEKEVKEQFTKLVKIIHIYGQLGDFLPGLNWLDYLSKDSDVNVYKCVESIKLMHEVDNRTENIRYAQNLIQEAEVVCFLGFGYYRPNLDILFSGIDWPVFRASVYGSAKGIDEGYRSEIYDYFTKPIKKVNRTHIKTESRIKGLGGKDDNILNFFNKNSVLTDKDK